MIKNVKDRSGLDYWIYYEDIKDKIWYICEYLCWDWVRNIYSIILDMIFLYQNDFYYHDIDIIIIHIWISSLEYKDNYYEDI